MDRALLVGINSYPRAPLAGCVNDIANVADMLKSRFGFPAGSVHLLADERATTKNILRELRWLVDGIQPGDRCVFHFSGHGVQVATKNSRREIDGLDEVICPVDFNWTERRMIRDKQLYGIFRKMPKGVKFAWINDSCHSGDLTRAMSKVEQTPRTIPLPADVAWDVDVAKEQEICCVCMSPCNEVMDVHSKSVTKGVLDVGFVSGCRSDQTSADTRVNGVPCGALTYFFVRNLKKMPKKTPLAKVVSETSKELAKYGYTQRPQAEGTRKNRPFLK